MVKHKKREKIKIKLITIIISTNIFYINKIFKFELTFFVTFSYLVNAEDQNK